MLKVENIETFYGASQALFGMDLEVREGEMTALLGRNGMGKTTTVRSIMGLTPAKSGAISFDGVNIRALPPYRIAQLGVGLAPEGRQIFPTLTARENLLATAANRHAGRSPWTLERLFGLFPDLGRRRDQRGDRLSGGEQQMLAIGRALMTNPRLLILDEATEGLAPRIRALIWKSLLKLKASGLSILVIDKNVEALIRICDRHFIIEKGKAAWSGASEELKADRSIQEKYLGARANGESGGIDGSTSSFSETGKHPSDAPSQQDRSQSDV